MTLHFLLRSLFVFPGVDNSLAFYEPLCSPSGSWWEPVNPPSAFLSPAIWSVWDSSRGDPLCSPAQPGLALPSDWLPCVFLHPHPPFPFISLYQVGCLSPEALSLFFSGHHLVAADGGFMSYTWFEIEDACFPISPTKVKDPCSKHHRNFLEL